MYRLPRLLPILALTLSTFAAPAASAASGDEAATGALRPVLLHIEHKDCKKAVEALNKGLASGLSDMALMAATMYEEGVCLKADWDKAVGHYQSAALAGSRAGLGRLIAGLAYQNRDPGAALWWAQRSQYTPGDCRVDTKVVEQPEAFIGAISAWPAQRLEGCVYALGVLNRIIGDMEFPGRALDLGMSADLLMEFVPAAGTISWKLADTDKISVTRVVRAGDEDSAIRKSVHSHVVRLGEQSLARYRRPDGIDPAWRVPMRFSFSVTY